MADRYWVGGTNTWNTTAGTKWAATSGGTGGESVPTSSDDVYFDSNSTGVVTKSYNNACRNFDSTGFAGSFSGTGTLIVYGSYTCGVYYGSAIYLRSSSTGKTVTTNGVSHTSGLYFDGPGGGWTLQDDVTLTGGYLSHQKGTLDTNSKAITASSFRGSWSDSRTLTLGSSVITLTTASASIHAADFTDTTGLTITANTAKFVFTGIPATGYNSFNSASAFDFNGLSIECNVAGIFRVNANGSTLKDLLRTGTAVKTDSIRFVSNVVVTGTLRLYGNSAVNRLWVHCGDASSYIPGTRRTVTNTGVTHELQHVDFEDFGLSTSYDASAITGLSGDCGGNDGITLSASQDHYWVGGSGNWSSTGEWSTSSGGSSGARVPLPQDDCYFDNNSFSGTSTVNVDMPRQGRNIDFSGYTEGATITWSRQVSPGQAIYGSIILPSVVTQNGSYLTQLRGRGSHTIRSSGSSFYHVTLESGGGTYTLLDAMSCSTGNLVVSYGSFDSAGYAVSCSSLSSYSTISATRSITLGSSIVTVTGTGNVLYLNSGTGLSVSAASATVVVNNTTASAKSVYGAGFSFGGLTVSGDAVTVYGSSSWGALSLDTAGLATGLILQSGETQSISGFSSNGSSGSLAKMASSSASAVATLSMSSGTVTEDYMHLTYIAATGGATWYAGANSTDNGGNTGWIFSGAGTTHAVSGTSSGAGEAVGAIVRAMKASGTLAGSAVAVGASTASRALTGFTAGEASAAGGCIVSRAFSSNVLGLGDVAGNLLALRILLGATSGQADADGVLQKLGKLFGASSGVGVLTGTLDLLVGVLPMAGGVEGTSSATGALTAFRTLAGGASGDSLPTGALTAFRTVGGSTAGGASAIGTLAALRAIAGNAAGASSLTGDLTLLVGIFPLTGSVEGTSSIAGALAAFRTLAGSTSGTSSVVGALLRIRSAWSYPIYGGSAMWEVQKAMYRTLLASPQLQQLAPKVYDGEPPPEENPPLPYIVLGEVTEISRDTLLASGRELSTTLHVYSDYQGHREVKLIGNAIVKLFDQQPRALDPMVGWVVEHSQLEMNEILPSFGEARHAVIRFRIRTRAVAV